MNNDFSYEIKSFKKSEPQIILFDGGLESLFAIIAETFPANSYKVIIDKVNEIIFGSEAELKKIEELKFLKDMRVFSKEKEFHLFLRNGKFYYRIREDIPVSEGQKENFEEALETSQYQRHSDPVKKILMRTYIDYDDLSQAGYYDFRIVDILEVK